MSQTTVGAELPACDRCALQVVIIDSGREARVIRLHLGAGAVVGSRFLYDGTTWVITGQRPYSKALVAVPVEH